MLSPLQAQLIASILLSLPIHLSKHQILQAAVMLQCCVPAVRTGASSRTSIARLNMLYHRCPERQALQLYPNLPPTLTQKSSLKLQLFWLEHLWWRQRRSQHLPRYPRHNLQKPRARRRNQPKRD